MYYGDCYIDIYSEHSANMDRCSYELTYTRSDTQSVFTYEGYEDMEEPIINVTFGTYNDGRILCTTPIGKTTFTLNSYGNDSHDFHVCLTIEKLR